MTTRVIILLCVHVTSLKTSMSIMHFVPEILFTLKATKSHFKGYMINRILDEWSFHIKFMNLTESSFHKFHMNDHL